jgi:hypothetical protein
MPYVNVHGVHLYYEEYGQGPAVILPPGGRVDRNGLRPLAALLSRRCSEQESAETSAFLFEHQLQEKFRYLYTWTEGDVPVWAHFGTIHRAMADYRPDEHRLMKRCQVMATKISDPEFRKMVALDPVAA